MPTAEKEAVVKDLADLLKRSTGVYLTDFTGLDVPSVTQLRGKLRAEGVTYRVVKNRLAKLAAREAGMEGLEEVLTGPTAVAASETDPVAPVRILTAFSKDTRGRPVVKVGLVDGRLYQDADLWLNGFQVGSYFRSIFYKLRFVILFGNRCRMSGQCLTVNRP